MAGQCLSPFTFRLLPFTFHLSFMDGYIKQSNRIKKLAIFYNQSVNMFWSVLNLFPIAWFCYRVLEPKWLYFFIAISLLSGFLPASFYYAMQLGRTTTVYKKIGIRFIKKFTQDGDFVNRLIRSKFPEYKLVENKSSAKKQLKKAFLNERFHFIMLSFFLLTTFYAFIHGHIWWAVILTINNLIYNIYPIFLQQYLRIRLMELMKRSS
jgi:hypothetical protein